MWEINDFQTHSILIHTDGDIDSNIEMILLKVGFSVDVARSDRVLREKLFKNNYDVLINESVKKTPFLADSEEVALPNTIRYSRSLLLLNRGDASPETINDSLKRGYDDICILPIIPAILLLRVNNLLRLAEKSEEGYLVKGMLKLNFRCNELHVNSSKIYLNDFESTFLNMVILSDGYIHLEKLQSYLLKNGGRFLSVNNLRVKIHRLKMKISHQSGAQPIRSRRGYGYYLSF